MGKTGTRPGTCFKGSEYRSRTVDSTRKINHSIDGLQELAICFQKISEMILQLNPEMMVYTPLGHGRTIFIIECGADMNTCWVVVLTATGEIKHFDSNDI